MKRPFATLLCTAALAACGNHYQVSSDPGAVLATWNGDVPQPELRLEPQGIASTMRTASGIWVT